MRLVVFLILAIIVVGLLYANQGYLLVNDVTTTLDDPPPLEKPMSEQTIEYNKKFYSHIRPLPLDLPPEEAYAVVVKEAEAMPGWTIVNKDPQAFTLLATAKTPLLGFEDDISIRVTPTKTGSVVHMRSKSQTGMGDLGTNARRIQAYLQKVAENA